MKSKEMIENCPLMFNKSKKEMIEAYPAMFNKQRGNDRKLSPYVK